MIDVLAAAADLHAMRAAELDRAFHRLRAGGEQEDFLQRIRQERPAMRLHQFRAALLRETVVVQDPGEVACLTIASTTRGWLCPALVTSTPLDQSIQQVAGLVGRPGSRRPGPKPREAARPSRAARTAAASRVMGNDSGAGKSVTIRRILRLDALDGTGMKRELFCHGVWEATILTL
jgi:hypothetical protein